ncbi:PREDICTED: heme-binding protein 2-like [Lupinus angustifolius]|uniref:heme-binding protein 2-like n=1 Tax=Lupinus angustifolius TaxID=3871 RepID=UPI00092E21CD|nr:PREDICTED: heme-binding protein 2-like [Lupinus angustifolius]
METKLVFLFYYLSIVMCYYCGKLVHAIELPKYRVIKSESDFEIRFYNESSWMLAPVVSGTSFEQSTKTGFHRLYQYIHGANLNSTKLAYTAPVLTSIPSSTSIEDRYIVRMYLSSNFEGKLPPQANPELKLQVEKWKTQNIAVRKFSGFAKDDNIKKEIEGLLGSLKKYLNGSYAKMFEDKRSYIIAQYNSSSINYGRLNEVWITV